MDIWDMRGFEAGRLVECMGRIAKLEVALALVLLVGCASPGPPQPPSLKLPEVVTGLTASRVGDAVRLQWTTPSRTTDKLLIAGPIVAEVCREMPTAAPSASAKAGQSMGQGAAQGARKSALTDPCSQVVVREQVSPGASEAVDVLPVELTKGSARLLAYRVQLRNTAGRTAGASAVVYAASGPAPQAVEELRGRATKAGVVLEWSPVVGGAEAIELDRTAMESPAVTTTATTKTTAATTGSGSTRKSGLPGVAKEPTESRFRVSAVGSNVVDAGGTVDRSAQIGHAYRYTMQRVRSVELGGQRLEVRSVASAEVPVEMKDVFPPEAPMGLVAVPGFAGEAEVQVGEQAQRAAIDLSWEPDMELHVAGYRVYRHDLDVDATNAWQQLNSLPAPVAAYRDLSVVAGRRYAYRVTAVDAAGNESTRSDEAVETAPAP
jgi:hypothetical protein